ncbi:LysR family transcriptional regulator substrate-binding protein [Thioclava sp. BHET1]|nr:LysR family transcriptional regulator substrate-binding protein [Thioclava sp. BHET1]
MQWMPVVVRQDDRETSMMLTEYLERAKRPLSIAYSVRQAATLMDLAASGLGIGIVPRLVVPAGLDKNVRVLSLGAPEVARDLGIATLKGEVLRKPALALADLFKTHLSSGWAAR